MNVKACMKTEMRRNASGLVNRCESVRPDLAWRSLIDVAPYPILSRLDRPHQRMPAVMKVLRGVLVL